MFSHREDKRDDRHLDILTDEENGLRIIVSRLGAELISLARANEAGEWIGFLYRDNDLTAPARGWANHATAMGYYLHRLKDGRSLYRGREIKGGTHGFLRSKTWHLVESKIDNRSLTYRITPRDFSATEYPLKVSLALTYKIDMNKVSVEFAFQNDEKELSAHVGFGLHPGFAATSFESFRLQMPAGWYRRHFSPGNYLQVKPGISIFRAAKCRSREINCPDLTYWNRSMCRCVSFRMSIHRAGAGWSSI